MKPRLPNRYRTDTAPEVLSLKDEVFAAIYPSLEVLVGAAREFVVTIWDKVDPNADVLENSNQLFKDLVLGVTTLGEVATLSPDIIQDVWEYGLYFVRSKVDDVNGGVSIVEYMSNLGYVVSDQNLFVKADHPLVRVKNEANPTVDTFENGVPPWSVLEGEKMKKELNQIDIGDISFYLDDNVLNGFLGSIAGVLNDRDSFVWSSTEGVVGYILDMFQSVCEAAGITPEKTDVLINIYNTLSRVLVDRVPDPVDERYDLFPVGVSGVLLPDGGLFCGWDETQVINGISDVIVGTDLTLDLITGNPIHNNIPLPGFGVSYGILKIYASLYNFLARELVEEEVIGDEYHTFTYLSQVEGDSQRYTYFYLFSRWVTIMSVEYYRMVYRELSNTMLYYDHNFTCQLNLPHKYQQLAADFFHINRNLPNLCASIEEERTRRRSIKESLVAGINPEDVSALILQPGTVWLEDALGTVKLFKQEDHLKRIPDDELPQSLAEITTLFRAICSSKEPQPIGSFIYILEKLGLDDPVYIHLVSREDRNAICRIITQVINQKTQRRLAPDTIPAEYLAYEDLCSNANSYPLSVFIDAAVQLGLTDDVKNALCVICQSKGVMGLMDIITTVRDNMRDDSIKATVCRAIRRFLDSVRVRVK